MIKGFRDFILRGNVVELAIAFVMGVAFSAVVTAFSKDFIGGIIGAIGGTPDFNNAGVTINDSKIVYGSTITALINFVIVAAVIYFLIVVPMNMLAERRRRGDEDAPGPSEEVALLTEIRDLLKRE
jgi:large conductance mechanosensitive channel